MQNRFLDNCINLLIFGLRLALYSSHIVVADIHIRITYSVLSVNGFHMHAILMFFILWASYWHVCCLHLFCFVLLCLYWKMREALESRLAAAEEVMKAAENEKLEKEELARSAQAEQEAIMEKVVQESKVLQEEAEENSKVNSFLRTVV